MEAVHDVNDAVFVDVDVVDAVGVGAFGDLRHKVGDLLRLKGVGGVEDADAAVEEGGEDEGVGLQGQLAGTVLVDVVGAVAAGAVEEVACRWIRYGSTAPMPLVKVVCDVYKLFYQSCQPFDVYSNNPFLRRICFKAIPFTISANLIQVCEETLKCHDIEGWGILWQLATPFGCSENVGINILL